MFRLTYYLLACTMLLTIVMDVNSLSPVFNSDIGLQCMDRGAYDGACRSQNEFGGELTCLRLACAFRRNDGSYLAVYTKPAESGTLCGDNKVCENNVCVSKDPASIAFPVETGPQFDCVSPPVAKIAPYPPASDPERNRPALVLPSVKGGESSGFTLSNSTDHLGAQGGQHSRPAASPSKGDQRSRPLASIAKDRHSKYNQYWNPGQSMLFKNYMRWKIGEQKKAMALTRKGDHPSRFGSSTSQKRH